MKCNDLISIVVPIYNVEKYLIRCIESIINQTYNNIEIILVDDGSTDSCGIICDEYKEKDNRIKVIHKENGGLSDARNKGLEVSKGLYIAFIDSDDEIDSTFVEKLYNACIETNSEIAICDYMKITDEVEKNGTTIDLQTKTYNAKEILYKIYEKNAKVEVVAWNKLYLKSLFDDIKYPKGKIHEDEATTYKLIYKSKKVVVLNQVLYYYYYNPNSITEVTYNKNRLDILTALVDRMEFYKSNGEDELYEVTHIRYCYELAKAYANIKKYLDDKELEKDILQKMKDNIRTAKKYKNASTKTKLKLELIQLFPNICAKYLFLKK